MEQNEDYLEDIKDFRTSKWNNNLLQCLKMLDMKEN